ncbi:cytochrome c biogenesis protein ResB [Rhizohabitans arisaemae]|uniref:cytochrome c biogenesis protein ResB n=1 Tax=Rhizohabitans arisaemae TaxID=2720610 RepID=UPI0024B0561F|nr:cytochrome c biogenesis protein ResB [Rhizohabitans arisaemae]
MGIVGWARWAWRLLTSMRTALILLFLMALASIPGSLLPQRGIVPEDVVAFYKENPTLAEVFDRLWLFDVFAAPWFAAIYLLLFTSLTGCVLPRLRKHLAEIRRKPPAAPRNLNRLPHHGSYRTDVEGEQALAAAQTLLRKRRYRVVAGPGWVAAEKGYLRETGNLFFHFALLGLLFAIGAGALYGYRANVIVTEDEGFANTVAVYDKYTPGSLATEESLHPFSFQLDDFNATYVLQGDRRGQALDFVARLRVQDRPGAPERTFDLRVNEPLETGGAQVYLLGHGYAPTFRVVDGEGKVAFDGPVPFLPAEQATFTSEGVLKVPDAKPAQLGALGLFLPTTVPVGEGFGSAFPGMINPTVNLFAYHGDLGLRKGPQSVYQLDTDEMTLAAKTEKPLNVGETLTLPEGRGSITFTGVREWISLQIAYDPGRLPALIASSVAVLSLVLSLTVRRRRVWVRLSDGNLEVGGLLKTEGSADGFAGEFGDIVTSLRGVVQPVKE